jgi:flagellar hook-associated protein 1
MGSLTSLIDLAKQALMADQAALNITATNVANQNTPGYTRQVATWQNHDIVSINGTVMTNPTVTAVSQRDRVLEQRLQQQMQVSSQSSALANALGQIEDIFGLSSTSTSAASTQLGTAIDSFFNAFSKLAGNPTDSATRQIVLAAANALASSFNSASNQLSSLSSGLDQEVGTIVGQVNSLTASIASLNQQIAAISPNSDAGALEDQRQQAIQQLSQLVGLDQITTNGNGITLTTSNGAVLVSGSNSFALTTSNVDGVTHVLAGTGTQQDVTSGLTGGQLGGVLAARDQQIPSIQNQLDQLASAIGTAVNQQNEQGLDGNGNAGQAIFSLPTSSTGAAAAITVATSDPEAIAAAATGEGAAGNTNATALSHLATSVLISGQTAAGYLASFLGRIGTTAAGANTDNTNQLATLTQLTTQRNSLSAVSLDEEAANLTNYQRSYEAASKVFTIADTIMASAINLGVATSVA